MVGRLVAPAARLKHGLQRGVIALDGVQLRDALVDEGAECGVVIHERVGDRGGAVKPRVKLAVLAPVEGLVARRTTEYPCKQADHERRLVSLKEALGTRRINAQANAIEGFLEALNDSALERREEERDLVRVGNHPFGD